MRWQVDNLKRELMRPCRISTRATVPCQIGLALLTSLIIATSAAAFQTPAAQQQVKAPVESTRSLVDDLKHDVSEAIVSNAARAEALTVEEALSSFEVQPGYQISALAVEPMVVDPVEVQVDDRGRLWVVEMRDYPFTQSPDAAPRGRIRVLSDSDFDGRYDSAELFADELDMPTGMALWGDGAVVTLAGKLAWYRDTDGDGKADRVEPWLRGFDQGNEQLRANHPRLGPDGRWYIASGLRGGTVQVTAGEPEDAPEPSKPSSTAIKLGSRDVRFDSTSGRLEAITGPAQFGLCFDALGNRYFCSNRNPAVRVLFEQSDLIGNPLAGVTAAAVDVIPAGESSEVYPIVDAWTTSNLHAGQYTAACGVYVAPHLMDANGTLALHNEIFVCEPTGSLVTRQTSRLSGAAATLLDDDWNGTRSWLASRDAWFRPVNITASPDGGVLVVDMHRAVIEHPNWVPEELKNRPDERWGDSSGRIYAVNRVASNERTEASTQPASYANLLRDLDHRPLSERSQEELLQLIANGNSWFRETASRLLLQRRLLKGNAARVRPRISVAQPLLDLAQSADTPPLGRIHALQLAWVMWTNDLRTGHPKVNVSRRTLELCQDLTDNPSPESNLLRTAAIRCFALHTDTRMLGTFLKDSPTDYQPALESRWAEHLLATAAEDNDNLRFESLVAYGRLPEYVRHATLLAALDATQSVGMQSMQMSKVFGRHLDLLDAAEMTALSSAMRDRPDLLLQMWLQGQQAAAANRNSSPASGGDLQRTSELAAAMTVATVQFASRQHTAGSGQETESEIRSRCTALSVELIQSAQSSFNQQGLLAGLVTLEKLAAEGPQAALRREDLAAEFWSSVTTVACDPRQLPLIRKSATALWAQGIATGQLTDFDRFAERAKQESEPVVAAELLSRWTMLVEHFAADSASTRAVDQQQQCDEHLVNLLRSASPRLKPTVVRLVANSPRRLQRVLELLSSGELRVAQIGASEFQVLTRAARGDLGLQFKNLAVEATQTDRSQVVAEYRTSLQLASNLAHGKQVFVRHCAACHQIGALGKAVGPDISDSRTKQPLELLTAILDPNLAIDNNYFRYRFLLETGDVLEGLIVQETAESVTIRNQEVERLTLRREDLLQVEATGLSLMPDGLETQIDQQSMSNLIGFIKGWRYFNAVSDDVPDLQDAN